MEEKRMPKRFMKAKVLYKKRRGIPGLRWQDEVEKELKTMKVIRWKDKTTDRTVWRVGCPIFDGKKEIAKSNQEIRQKISF